MDHNVDWDLDAPVLGWLIGIFFTICIWCTLSFPFKKIIILIIIFIVIIIIMSLSISFRSEQNMWFFLIRITYNKKIESKERKP